MPMVQRPRRLANRPWGSNISSISAPPKARPRRRMRKKSDGDDKIFGDLGNDWLVGGSGRDDTYGGFGNDLLNADDDLTTAGSLNNTLDTSASYEDRAFGGAGRDVLIANTGGDRLIDWSGEFDSYLVPISPFGTATVSRMLQPRLQDFLYALSRVPSVARSPAPPAPTITTS
jgi:Ca2+-binding RTX toxin-like protein